MYSFVPLVWVLAQRRELRRWLLVAFLAMSAFYLSVLTPVVGLSRALPKSGSGAAADIVSSLDYFRSSTVKVDYWEEVEIFLYRQFDPTPMGYFVGHVRSAGLQLGRTMSYIRYAFIPRLVWPDKPNVTRGAWFTNFLGFSKTEERATTSTGMTATGELYWNFGIYGVVAGMFAIGCLLSGILWRLAGTDPTGSTVRMMLYLTITLNMNNMPEAVTIFVGIVINTLVGCMLLLLLEHRRRPQVYAK